MLKVRKWKGAKVSRCENENYRASWLPRFMWKEVGYNSLYANRIRMHLLRDRENHIENHGKPDIKRENPVVYVENE